MLTTALEPVLKPYQPSIHLWKCFLSPQIHFKQQDSRYVCIKSKLKSTPAAVPLCVSACIMNQQDLSHMLGW